MDQNNVCALVLGGYVNGYSIIKELYEKKVSKIVLFDSNKSLSCFSNKICEYHIVNKSAPNLKKAIFELYKKVNYIVIFPTDDIYIELLNDLYSELHTFCFIPFNNLNIRECLNKHYQYSICESLGIPHPKTIILQTKDCLSKIKILTYPVLIKPNKRYDYKDGIFRSLLLNSDEDYSKNLELLKILIEKNVPLIVSELIPGDDTNIYAYVGYRSYSGKILNEWVGKKLTQYPDNFGVFSSAVNSAPEIVRKQGRLLLEAMSIYGIAEPEFKYDIRDKKYKLMEVNLRSMMWHRLGNVSGVNLQYTQFQDATGYSVKKQEQNLNSSIHFVYMKHELINLVFRKSYWKHFKYNVFGAERRVFAVFNINDIGPFVYDCFGFLKGFISRCLKKLY